MRRKRTDYSRLSEEDIRILTNRTVTSDVASFMVDMPAKQVIDYRYRESHREQCKEASKKAREKMKAEHEALFGTGKRQYDYWRPEEIEYIITSSDSDKKMARKLKRSIQSIQKKRSRVLQERESDGA